MKLYRVHHHDNSCGQRLSWHTNKAQAEARLRWEIKEAKRMFGKDAWYEPCGIELWEIPTDRAGLALWLNAWLDSNNG